MSERHGSTGIQTLKSSSSSALCTLLDSHSRDAGDSDDSSSLGSWKRVRVCAVLPPPDGRVISKGSSPQEWAAVASIGHFYNAILSKALAAVGSKRREVPIGSRFTPWGACLPVRITDMNAFQDTPVGSWLEKYVPGGSVHPYTTILFYELMEPEEEEEAEFDEDTRDTCPSQQDAQQRLLYVVDLFVPVEIDDITGGLNDRRLPDEKFFRPLENRNGNRVQYYNRAPPADAWHIATPGEYIDLGVTHNEGDLVDIDANQERLNRFVDSFTRALYELTELDKGTSVPTSQACRAILAKDYWGLRHTCKSFAEFRAIDSRTRLLAILALVYCANEARGDHDSLEFVKRLENALVRFVRSEYLLGWPTEHTTVDLLNSYQFDTGRVPAEYTRAAGKKPQPATVPTSGASGNMVKTLQAKLLTVQPTMRTTLMKEFEKILSRTMPPIGSTTSLDVFDDLKALSDKRRSGCISGVWVRRADRVIECRTDAQAVLRTGESFVVTEGYPTRFYFVRDPSRGAGIGYDTLARKLHAALNPRQDSPELKQYVLPIGDSRLELVVYPGIVLTNLQALRVVLGTKCQDVHHTVPERELWRTLPPSREDLGAERVSLMDPQPSVDEVMHGVRVTLMSHIVTDGDSDGNRYSYDTEALHDACETLRKTYISGHTSEATSSSTLSALPQPSIYWLRPNSDVISAPLETLPKDAVSHFTALPKVDRHRVGANKYGSASVLAYRDVPFMLSEQLRALIRETKDECIVEYSGDWTLYLRKSWCSANPTELSGHVRAVLSALRGRIPISKIATTTISEPERETTTRLSPKSTFVNLTDDQYSDAGDVTLDTDKEIVRMAAEFDEGDGAALMIAKRKRQIEEQAAEVMYRLAKDSRINLTAEPEQPNGLNDANDVHQAVVRERVQWTKDQLNVFAMAKVLEPYMDDARKVPQRFLQAIWERPEDDQKRTIHLDTVQGATKKGEFFWNDRKSGVGYIGPLTLLAYTYAIRVGNARYSQGESTHREERGVGYKDVDISEIVEIKRRIKEEADAAKKRRAEEEGDGQRARKPFDPSQLVGPLAFVRDMIELVRRVSATWPKPAETFGDWYRKILDPFVATLRSEEEAARRARIEEARRKETEGRTNEELLEDGSEVVDPTDIVAPSKTSKASTHGLQKPAAPNDEKDAREVSRLWKDSLRITTEMQASYLRQCRGLYNIDADILEHSPFLRFVDMLSYKLYHEDGQSSETVMHPALLVFCVGATGCTGSLQRIYLQRHNGDRFYSKLVVPQYKHKKNKIKRTLGSLKFDAQFFMAQPGRIERYPFVYLSEGPEKAMAIAACSRYAATFASFGVGRYGQFEHFRDMDPQPTLVIAGDADGTITDQEAKITTLKRNGWKNVIHWVPTCSAEPGSHCHCKDANDVIDAHGIWELRRSLCIPEWAWTTRFPEESELYEPPEKEWRRYKFLSKYEWR